MLPIHRHPCQGGPRSTIEWRGDTRVRRSNTWSRHRACVRPTRLAHRLHRSSEVHTAVGLNARAAGSAMGPARARLALLALALLIAVARLHTYDEPLELDITVAAVIGNELLAGRQLYTDLWDHKPPALHITHALAILLVGYGSGAIYLLNVGAAVVTLLGVYAAASAVAGAVAGLWGATFWTLVSGDVGLQANQPNAEVFVNACVVWAFAFLIRVDQGARGRRFLAIGALFALGSLYKPVVVAPAAVLATAHLVAPPVRLLAPPSDRPRPRHHRRRRFSVAHHRRVFRRPGALPRPVSGGIRVQPVLRGEHRDQSKQGGASRRARGRAPRDRRAAGPALSHGRDARRDRRSWPPMAASPGLRHRDAARRGPPWSFLCALLPALAAAARHWCRLDARRVRRYEVDSALGAERRRSGSNRVDGGPAGPLYQVPAEAWAQLKYGGFPCWRRRSGGSWVCYWRKARGSMSGEPSPGSISRADIRHRAARSKSSDAGGPGRGPTRRPRRGRSRAAATRSIRRQPGSSWVRPASHRRERVAGPPHSRLGQLALRSDGRKRRPRALHRLRAARQPPRRGAPRPRYRAIPFSLKNR
jgi:hypothetical protein